MMRNGGGLKSELDFFWQKIHKNLHHRENEKMSGKTGGGGRVQIKNKRYLVETFTNKW